MKNFQIFFVIFISIFSSSSTFNITCRYNTDLFWNQLGHIYHCEVTSSSLNAGSNISHVSGTHLHERTNFDVTGIFFNQNCAQISSVPINIRDFFPNLLAINLRGCGITNPNGRDLQPYNNLLSFSISHTIGLVEIPGNLFSNTPSIFTVNFDNNRIARVGRDLLSHLQHLQSAFFNFNICISSSAWNREGLLPLIELLRQNCAEPIDQVTPTTELVSTTTNEYGCVQGNYDDRICTLEAENKLLRNNVENLQNEVEKLAKDFKELQRVVLDLTSRPCAC